MTLTHARLQRLLADMELWRAMDTPPSRDTLALWIAWVQAALATVESDE